MRFFSFLSFACVSAWFFILLSLDRRATQTRFHFTHTHTKRSLYQKKKKTQPLSFLPRHPNNPNSPPFFRAAATRCITPANRGSARSFARSGSLSSVARA